MKNVEKVHWISTLLAPVLVQHVQVLRVYVWVTKEKRKEKIKKRTSKLHKHACSGKRLMPGIRIATIIHHFQFLKKKSSRSFEDAGLPAFFCACVRVTFTGKQKKIISIKFTLFQDLKHKLIFFRLLRNICVTVIWVPRFGSRMF